MPVVINELEMTPAPPTKTDSGGTTKGGEQGPTTLKPDTLREIEKAWHRKQERIHRLTAY